MLMFRPISLALLCKLDVFLNCICVSRWDSKAMSPHNKFSTLLKIIHLLPIVHYILCKMLLLDRLTWVVYQSTLGFFHKLYEYFLIVWQCYLQTMLLVSFCSSISCKKSYRIYDVRIGSALKISAGKVSFPGALLFFKVLIAAIISNFDGSSVLISKSVFASGICFLL